MRFTGFIGPSYKLNSVNVDCQRCINLYPEINEIGTGKEREVASLVSTPGLSTLKTFADGPIRGLFTSSAGRLFAVAANKLYELDQTFNSVEIGALSTYSGPVSMSDNGLHLILVDGIYGYTYTFSSLAFAQITDPDFPGADQVVFQDGYFIFNKPDSGQFFISELNSIDFDGLDIATSEGNPDNIVGIISDHRDLWIFNEKTTEVFFNSGSSDFPFERVSGAFIEHGCAAPFSIAKMSNTVFWVGRDDNGAGIIWNARGYQPQRVSTHAIEQAIAKYGDISSAKAYTYQENGHHFYIINFPNAETSWAYDMSTNLWHERIFTNQGNFERHRADCHAFAFSKHIVGDYQNGKIYDLSSTHFSDNGDEITRQRIAPHITSGLQRVFFSSFQLDMETGTGLDGIGQGTDPKVMLQFSDDGGHSWSNEKWASIGKIGQTKKRAIWRRLGQSRDRVFKISVTDPVKVILIGAELEMQEGAS